MLSIDTVKKGLHNGLYTTWVLTKVIVPVYLGVSILSKTVVMDWLAWLAQPVMSLMGLPGEAATGLVVGNLLNIYAAIGALGPLQLNTREITVAAIVLLISHNLLVETAVSKQTGINVKSLVLVRLLGGLSAGILLNWGWSLWM